MKALGCFFYSILLILTITSISMANVSDGLIAHYPLNGSSQEFGNDASGNGHSGIGEGAITSARGLSDALNTAVDFCSDSTCQIKVNNHSDFSVPYSGKISVTYWANLRVASANAVRFYTSSAEGGYSFSIASKPHMDLFYAGGSYTRLWAADYFPINEWVHVAYVIDRAAPTGSGKIYMNNVLSSSSDEYYLKRAENASCSADIQLGRHGNGRFDDIRIYNRALSASDIDEIYNLRNEFYNDYIDMVGDVIDTDNSGSNEAAFLKKNYQGISVHLKDQDSTSTPTDRIITGFFNSSTDWDAISVSIMNDSVHGGQSIAVLAVNKLTDKVEICVYDLNANPGAFRPVNIEVPLYDFVE